MDFPAHLATLAIDGATFHFDIVLGRVANEQKWSETRVWGSGGGGCIGRHGGHLAPVQLRSAVDLNQEIWLQLPDGSPYCLHVKNMNVQVLERHLVSVVLIRTGRQTDGWVGLVCNLATGTVFEDPAFSLWLAQTYTPSKMAAALLKLAAVGVAGATMWGGLYLAAFVLLFLGLAIAGKISRSLVEDKGQIIRRHVLRLNDWLVEEMEQRARAGKAQMVETSS